jgi:hypothetical protein
MSGKKAARRAVQEEIDVLCSDVDEMYRPSVHQYGMVKGCIYWGEGSDPDGYFLGRCMIGYRKGDKHVARYNFLKGIMRCDADGDRPSCHAGRGNTISLSNVLHIIMMDVVDG